MTKPFNDLSDLDLTRLHLITHKMDFVTDCDYCGQISLCFEDEAGGTCCHSCDREDDYDGQPDEAQEWYDYDPDC
jgi:hypothetical protein